MPAPLVERVLDGLPSERSRQAYDRILEDFLPSTGPTSLARPLSANSMGLMLKRRLKNAGLASIFRRHSFRVPVVTNLLSQDVQYLACHANPRTTQFYDWRRWLVTRIIVEKISV